MNSISQSPPSTIPDRGAISEVQAGASAPLGASVTADGVNFSVFSKRATGIDLLLFEHVDDEKPASVIHVHPASNRTYHYWHVFAPALKAGQIYGYRVYGPFEPSKGFRFDATKVLLDPYGRAVVVPRHEERCSRPEPLRLGKRPSTPQVVLADNRVRDACAGIHEGSKLRSARGDAWHLLWRHRKDTIPAGTRSHGGRAHAGVPVRRTRLPDRARQLLGLRTGLVLRAAPGVQFAAGPARSSRRVPRHGESTAPGRHRSDS